MLNKFILASVSILLTSFAHGDKIYQLRDSTGTTILTSKPDLAKYQSMTIVKVTSYPSSVYSYLYEDTPDGKKYIEIMSGANRRSETIVNYKRWVDAGKLGNPPLIPERVTKELVFLPIIIAKVKSGSALIGQEQKALDFTYENHTSCIGDKTKNLQDFRKTTSFNINKNIVFPKDTKVSYDYKCISRLIEVHQPIISQDELDKELKFIIKYENRMKSKREKVGQQFEEDLKQSPKIVYPDGRVVINITDDQPSTKKYLDQPNEALSNGIL